MEVFDLARIYSAAENIKNARADRQYRSELLGLRQQEFEQQQLSEADKKHLQERYTMWEASADNPVLRKQILDEARRNDKEGRLAALDDQTLSSYIDKGLKLRLGIEDKEPRLVATEEGFVEAKDAIGKKPFRGEASQPKPNRASVRKREYMGADGKDWVEEIRVNPDGTDGPVIAKYRKSSRGSQRSDDDWGAAEQQAPGQPDQYGFIPGQRYTDADGNTAIYRGNNQWDEG